MKKNDKKKRTKIRNIVQNTANITTILTFIIGMGIGFGLSKIQINFGQNTSDINNSELNINSPNGIINNGTMTIFPKSEQEIAIEETTRKSKEIIRDFYTQLNQGKYNAVKDLFQLSLLKYSEIVKYFSEGNLGNFFSKITGQLIFENVIEKVEMRKDTNYSIRCFNYDLKYIIKGMQYKEKREMCIKYENKNYLINKINCETPDCGKLPFFNIEKY